MATKKSKSRKALLLGVGFDHKDGHKRITQGPKFLLIGGSEETHAEMQEKAIKFNERLKKRGKQLEELGRQEFRDIAHELGMPVIEPKQLPHPL
jgi:hypothetical protein